MKFNSTIQKGFSLVETLVAITILLFVIIGPMTIISATSKSTSFSSEQVVAFFLAQEGAELAQKGRDDFLLKAFLPDGHLYYDDIAWDTFVDPNGVYRECFTGSGCGLEVIAGDVDGALKTPVNNCLSSGTECKLYYNPAGERARYTHDAGGNDETLYARVITFDNSNPDEVKVISKVTWRTGSLKASQEVLVETYLFNVYGKSS